MNEAHINPHDHARCRGMRRRPEDRQRRSSGGGGVPPPPHIAKSNDRLTSTAPRPAAAEGRDLEGRAQGLPSRGRVLRDATTRARGTSRRAGSRRRSSPRSCTSTRDLVAAQFMVGLSATSAAACSTTPTKAYQQATTHEGRPDQAGDGAVEPRHDLLQARARSTARSSTGIRRSRRTASSSRRASTSRRSSSSRCARSAAKDPKWKTLEEDARINLSNALGVESDNVEAYTTYGLLYMEGWQQNKNRLLLAKLLLDEGKKRNEKYPALLNAYGLYWMHRGALNEALAVVHRRRSPAIRSSSRRGSTRAS